MVLELLEVCFDDVAGGDVLEAGQAAHGRRLHRDPEHGDRSLTLYIWKLFSSYQKQ